MRLPRAPIRRARIEIIPMIDTIFFLLVFFMIASLTMVRMRAMAVALPKGTPAVAGAATAGSGGDLILTMTGTGDYYLGKRRVGPNPELLQSALASRFETSPPRDVVLNFNRGRSTQEMIAVMDILNRAKGASGKDVPVLIATAPVDQNGRALSSDGLSPPGQTGTHP